MLTEEMLEQIEEAADWRDVDYTPSYSGRGMFGEQCIAVDGEEWALIEWWSDLTDELKETLGKPSKDSMGLGEVWYWPGMTDWRDE